MKTIVSCSLIQQTAELIKLNTLKQKVMKVLRIMESLSPQLHDNYTNSTWRRPCDVVKSREGAGPFRQFYWSTYCVCCFLLRRFFADTSPVGATGLFGQPEDRLMSAALMFNSYSSTGLTVTTINDSLSLPSSASSLGAAAQRGRPSASAISCPLPHLPQGCSFLLFNFMKTPHRLRPCNVNCPFPGLFNTFKDCGGTNQIYLLSIIYYSPSTSSQLIGLTSLLGGALRRFVFWGWV